MNLRLNKFIARSRGLSRRKADDFIQGGRVSYANSVCLDPAFVVDSQTKSLKIDGAPIVLNTQKIYLILNKPQGYICTKKDPEGRRDVYSLLSFKHQKLFSVGRLDIQTEGLLLFTNDGDFSYRVMHPRYKIEKSYTVLLHRPLLMNAFLKIKHRTLSFAAGQCPKVKLSAQNKKRTLWNISLTEGWYRVVRRLFEAVGCRVLSLRRYRVGSVCLAKLPLGTYRFLTQKEKKDFENCFSKEFVF